MGMSQCGVEVLVERTKIMLLCIFKYLENVLLTHSSNSADAQLGTENNANSSCRNKTIIDSCAQQGTQGCVA